MNATHQIQNFQNQDGTLDFEKLYSALEVNVVNGNINRKDKGDLALFDYSRQCQLDGAWNDATRISRGLILDVKNKVVVALPPEKFFNYGDEHRTHGRSIGDPRWKGAEIHEKMDGSLGVCWHYQGEWHVSTRGSFDSEQAVWATRWLYENVDTQNLIEGLTYIFEIIYHENQIVVNYDYEGLVLLTIYNTNCMLESCAETTDFLAKELGVKRPESYKFDKISELTSWVKGLPKDQEGVVVKFPSGTRVKIKGDEYCRIHKILAHHSPLVVWENLRDKGIGFLEEYKLNIPEEFWDETDEWLESFTESFTDILVKMSSFHQETIHLSDKELGLYLKENKSPYGRFVFGVRKNPTGFAVVGAKERKKIFDFFKPSGNIMPCQ